MCGGTGKKLQPVSDGLSALFYQVRGQRSIYREILDLLMLPSADLSFLEVLVPFSSSTSTWFKDRGLPVLHWPANPPASMQRCVAAVFHAGGVPNKSTAAHVLTFQ